MNLPNPQTPASFHTQGLNSANRIYGF